jgi:hypothetical protein
MTETQMPGTGEGDPAAADRAREQEMTIARRLDRMDLDLAVLYGMVGVYRTALAVLRAEVAGELSPIDSKPIAAQCVTMAELVEALFRRKYAAKV